MELAYTVAGWSSCFQENRQIGAVIVRDKRILTTGYNGAPGNVTSCKERGECLRRRLNIPSGTRQELCYAVHAEQNAVIQAARIGVALSGATLYCTHQPCVICAKIIINGFRRRISGRICSVSVQGGGSADREGGSKRRRQVNRLHKKGRFLRPFVICGKNAA